MRRRILTATAIALLATTPALSQDASAVAAGLNTEVYDIGMTELVGDGFQVDLVHQDMDGVLTFSAHAGATVRVLVLNGEGEVVSDSTEEPGDTEGEEVAEEEGEEQEDGHGVDVGVGEDGVHVSVRGGIGSVEVNVGGGGVDIGIGGDGGGFNLGL